MFYEKTLDDGRVLQTHLSHSGQETMSAGRFSGILRHQLEVSREGPVEHEAWVVAVLVEELHMTPEDLEALSPEEAQRLVGDHWSKPR